LYEGPFSTQPVQVVDRLLDTVHDMVVGPHNGASTHWPELGSLALSVHFKIWFS